MNKKTIAAILMASILCIASCNNNTPATTTTAANTTTTTVAETTENTTTETVEDTVETTTEVAETTAPVTQKPINETGPLDETILEKNVSANYQSAYDQFTDTIASGTYTFIIDKTIYISAKELPPMSATIVSDPELGIYYDGHMDRIFKCIFKPDGSVIKFNDTDMYYVTMPPDKATISTNDAYAYSTAIMAVKDNIITADMVQLPAGNKAYRFIINPENNASTAPKYKSNVYVYFDETTGYPVAIYTEENKQPTKMWFEINNTVDASIFEIPSEYTEISYEEYISMTIEGCSYADIIANRG